MSENIIYIKTNNHKTIPDAECYILDTSLEDDFLVEDGE